LLGDCLLTEAWLSGEHATGRRNPLKQRQVTSFCDQLADL